MGVPQKSFSEKCCVTHKIKVVPESLFKLSSRLVDRKVIKK